MKIQFFLFLKSHTPKSLITFKLIRMADYQTEASQHTSPYSHHRIKHYLLDLREFMTSQRTYIQCKHVFLTYIHCKCSAIKLQDCPDTVSTKCQEEKKKRILDKNDEMMLSSIQTAVSFVWKTYINRNSPE